MEAVVGILGMAPCDGTDAVPPNARSHTVLLAGTLIGDAQVLLFRPLCVFFSGLLLQIFVRGHLYWPCCLSSACVLHYYGTRLFLSAPPCCLLWSGLGTHLMYCASLFKHE